MPSIVFQPGVISETTPYDVGAGWIDASLIRFRMGKAQPMGGWLEIGTGLSLTGVCRTAHEWSNNDGLILMAFGTNSNVEILSADALYDITPAGFVPGAVDASVSDGYGVGLYSAGTYGTPRVPIADGLSQIITEPLIWSIDNFGEDLILSPLGGPIYIWHATGGFGQRATLLSADPSASNVPILVDSGVFVNTQAQTVVALGCNPIGSTSPDPMQIRWSDLEDPFDWTPTTANSAGGYRLPVGSTIIGYINTYYETLIWTDKGVYSMQYVGAPLVYGFPPISQDLSMISPHAATSTGTVVYWMDKGSFYVYNGSVAELPCPLKEEVFDNLNILQSWKVFAAHIHSFSEILWFYPSNNSTEIDSYVMYNYRDNVWSKGQLIRTAWSDSGRLSTPVGVDPSGFMYFHETGTTANGSPLPYYLISGDMSINDGEVYTLLTRLIPDFNFRKSLGQNQRFLIDYMTRDTSNQPRRTVKTIEVTPNANNRGNIDQRVRGRRVSIKLYSDSINLTTSWISGKLQGFYVANGRR